MKAVPDNFLASFSAYAEQRDSAIDSSLLGRIGDDLRHLYDEVTDAELPRSLLALAETIDARRMGDGPRD